MSGLPRAQIAVSPRARLAARRSTGASPPDATGSSLPREPARPLQPPTGEPVPTVGAWSLRAAAKGCQRAAHRHMFFSKVMWMPHSLG